MNQYDLIIIGAGHNGLTAAAYAGKAGKKVLVLEKSRTIGGLCRRDEFAPGFTASGVLQDTSALRPWVVKDLDLMSHGLKLRNEEVPVFLPEKNGRGILLWREAQKMSEELAGAPAKDLASYKDYRSFLTRIAPFIKKVFDGFPPDLIKMSFPGLWDMGLTAVSLRMMGKEDMMEVLRIGPMCSADFLNEFFESELLKAGLALPSVISTYQGPWSPGSNANLLLAECLAQNPIEGGASELIAALEKACLSHGVEIKTSCEVEQIVVEGQRVVGVTVAGEHINASKVAAACDPKTLFFDLMPRNSLSLKFEKYIGNWRCRGTTAKIDLALSAYPEFACRPGLQVEYARIGDTLDYLEKAFDSVKYGEFSQRPALDLYFPTVENAKLAPSGQHVLSVLVSFAPYDLKQGWNEDSKSKLYENVMQVLQEHLPNLESLVVGKKISSPQDIESEYGTTEGHLHHGEHAADQLLVRPTPETSRYQTPFEGLYMCGAGSHPGGGVTCAPGAFSSRVILGH